jgi:hypothetical protein
MFSFVVYTHSDYFDILPIQLEYVKKVLGTTYPLYVFSNSNFPGCEYPTILYDDQLPYASRILSCLHVVTTDYVVVMHENDIILSMNSEVICSLPNIMSSHNIDSVTLKHEPRGSAPVPVIPELSLVAKYEYFFCVQPTLWNKSRLIELFSTFPDKIYRKIEDDDVQAYMVKHYKAYALCSTKSIPTVWYNVAPEYKFIHLTSRLLLLPCSKRNNLDPYIQSQHEYIFTKYLSSSKRGIQRSLHSYENSVAAANPN